jgi:transcriptional regulator with XRE-family HTH domain
MFAAFELSQAVKTRRSDMGLTQTALSELCGLSRATVNQIENGTINDLSLTRTARLLGALGLALTVAPARPKSNAGGLSKTSPLTLAARTARVSYRNSLTPEMLENSLLSGAVPPGFAPHLNALLEDASVSLLASVVEQLHEKTGVQRPKLWATMRTLAHRFDCRRDIWRQTVKTNEPH